MGAPYQWVGETLHLNVRVQTRASRNEIVGISGQRLKVRLTGPPVQGQANRELLKLIAKAFSVPLRRVRLARGDRSRNKTLEIEHPLTTPSFVRAVNDSI